MAPLAVVAFLLTSPVAAQDEPSERQEAPASNYVELPGRCEGAVAPIAPGIGIDCVFPLRPDRVDELDGVDGAEDGIIDGIWAVDPAGEWRACRVDGDLVRCSNVGESMFEPVDGFVELVIGEETWPEAAPFRTTFDAGSSGAGGASGGDDADDDADDEGTTSDSEPLTVRFSLHGTEQVTFPGLPLEFRADTNRAVGGRVGTGVEVFGVVRPRNQDTIVDRIRLDEANAIEFDLDVGRYRIWPCVGDTVDDCIEQAAGHPFQIIDPGIQPLTPDHNRPSAQRVNVLFVGAGLDHVGGIEPIARSMLGLDGPVPLGVDGRPVSVADEIVDLRFGPMAIEPLAEHADRFNFWFLPTDLGDELALVYDALFNDPLDVFGLDHLQVTAIYDQALDGASDARGTSFYGRQNVPPVEAIEFGGTRVAVDPYRPLLASETLAHEWGHAIFELRDEYYGFDGRDVSHGYPNCAPDAATAEDWWGRRIGSVDPFAFEVAAARADAGLDPNVWAGRLVDLVRVEVTTGGCYGNVGEATAYRPSQNSLMNSEFPVFGTINRLRVETVFDRFSGRGPLTSLDDVTIDCAALGDRTRCDVMLRSHLDLTGDPLLVSGLRCEPASEADEDVLAVTCAGPRLVGVVDEPTETVTVALGVERIDVPVANLDPAGGQPTSPTSPPSTSPPALPTDDSAGSDGGDDEAAGTGTADSEGSGVAGAVVLGGLVVAISAAAWIGGRARRSLR